MNYIVQYISNLLQQLQLIVYKLNSKMDLIAAFDSKDFLSGCAGGKSGHNLLMFVRRSR